MPRIGEPTTVLSAALKLHDAGYWIVPCEGKRPTVSDWPNIRLNREELRESLEGTDLNIAIVLNQSNVIDVECDSPEAERALLAMFGGEIPRTPTWESARGKHRLFRRPDGLPSKAKIDVEGIEFRIGNSKGALSCVPPSTHETGMRYRWISDLSLFDIPPVSLPTAIVERLNRPTVPGASVIGGSIPEGQRNDTLFKRACQFVEAGIGEDDLIPALLGLNSDRCEPPLPRDEVLDIARSALAYTKTEHPQRNGDILISLCEGVEFWCAPNGTAYATIARDGHREHWPVRSRSFRDWLSREFWLKTTKTAGTQTLQDVISVFEGQAKFGGGTYPVAVRVAEFEGRIYLDLVDERWRAVEVDAEGWRIVASPPVRFRRAPAMLPLPVPEKGHSISELRRFVNVDDEHWPLLLGFLVSALRPNRPCPILKLSGEQGSGKSTQARVFRDLIDPNSAPLRSAPKSERDLMIATNNSWLISLDNLSYLNGDMSDVLCRLVTGGGFATRTLYTDNEEMIFDAQRPVILNGIEDVAHRSDLIQRCLSVELPRIEDGERQAEKEFWAEFAAAQPRLLGALLDAVSIAMRNLPAVARSQTKWPRMADFAQWVVAAESSLGLQPGEFLAAYESNQALAGTMALESSPVVTALKLLLAKPKRFEGTATKLLEAMTKNCPHEVSRGRNWPKNARALSGILSRLAPNLRQIGIDLEQERVGNEKLWRIRYANPQSTQISGPILTRKTSDAPDPKSRTNRRLSLPEHLRHSGYRGR